MRAPKNIVGPIVRRLRNDAGLSQPMLSAEHDPEFPPLSQLARQAHMTQSAWVDATRPYWQDLPTLVALGQLDSI